MLSRLLAMSLIGISLTGCNTMHGMGQDFNSVFAPSKTRRPNHFWQPHV